MKSTLRIFQQYLFVSLLGIICATSYALAGGLQISPVTLTLQGTKNAEGVWLNNEGNEVLSAQVRVYHWTQSGYSDKLTPSQGLVISPPMLTLEPGQKQLVRVIRTGSTAGNLEDAWRLSIDELPPTTRQVNKLKFVMKYSMPVFVQPAGLKDAAPKLQWNLVQAGGKTFLEAHNNGNSHAQLSQVTFINPRGIRKVITPGLLGYVLPDSTMRWIISSSTKDVYQSGKIELMINGQKTIQDL